MNLKITIAGWVVIMALAVRTLSAALPVSDSFESPSSGSMPASSNGWGVAGYGQGWVTNSPAQSSALVDWAVENGVGYPIPDATHIQVLAFNGTVSNRFGETGEQSCWFDFMLAPQAWTGAVPPVLSSSTLCAFYVTPERSLALARASTPGLPSSNLWTILPGVGIATDAWSRITVQWVAGVDAAFFSVRVNGGDPVSHVSAWSAPDETAPLTGSWFPCPNAGLRLTPVSFQLNGGGYCDDWRLSNVRPSFDPAPISTAVITPFCDTALGSLSPGTPSEVPVGQAPQFEVQALPHHHITALFTNTVPIAHDFAANPTDHFVFVWASVPAGWHTIKADFAPDLTLHNTSIPWLLQYYPEADDFADAAVSDTDGDGLPAWAEYIAGTDPTNPASLFLASGVQPAFGTNYTEYVYDAATNPPSFEWTTQRFYAVIGYKLLWPSTSGRLYDVEYATNLLPGKWTYVNGATNLLSTPPVNTITNTPPSFTTQPMFYRLRVRLP
ncbi:MAG: thrombospondin type 3 repeat-containing protein [bacterium]